MNTKSPRNSQAGFSLIEMMIALLVISIIMGAVFAQIDQAQQRSAAEETKLDSFQQAREFMDHLTRDLRQAGYPNPQNYANGILNPTVGGVVQDPATSPLAAVGLVYINNGDLWFEGDVDGTGQVSSIQYHLEQNGPGCPCLRRSQVPKVAGAPGGSPIGSQGESYSVEVQNVVNGSAENPIFYAYTNGGDTPVALPLTWGTDNITLATVDTIKIIVTVEAAAADMKTGERPITTLVSTVRLNNCSQGASAGLLACE
ncbi:MAG: type II secretion system protein J [Terriglobales bacterium]